LDLRHGSRYDFSVHVPDLFIHLAVLVSRVVDKYNTHETEQIIWVLVIDRNTSLIFERLANSTLEKILVEL